MCSKYRAIITILSSLSLLFYIMDEEDLNYIKVVNKTWKNKPIFDIITEEREGYEKYSFLNTEDISDICDCSFIGDYRKVVSGKCNSYQLESGCIQYNKKKASIYDNKEFYVSYYDADYLTLFSRVDNDNSNLCKDGFKRCGYLDVLNNAFCVKETEQCPINYLKIDKDKIITNNTYKDSHIINRLYISEYEHATIFDIDRLYTKNEIIENKNYYVFNRTLIYYNLTNTYNNILKSDFFTQNDLFKGNTPDYFNKTKLYLFQFVYPGNNKGSPLSNFFIFIIDFRFAILFPLLLIKILMSILLFRREGNNDEISLFLFILDIFLIVCYVAFEVFNLLFFIAKFKVQRIIYFYDYNFWSSFTSISTGTSGLVWAVIFLLPDIFIIISTLCILFSLSIKMPEIDFKLNLKSKEDKNEEKEKSQNNKKKELISKKSNDDDDIFEKPYYNK